MSQNLVAQATITIKAPKTKVWSALVTPAAIKQYMFGTDVRSEWQEGKAITWQGEWQGKAYQDKGVILQLKPGRKLQYTHFSPLSRLPDTPENYHTVTIELSEAGAETRVTLAQDNNPTDEARAHSEKNWSAMLRALKQLLER
jgi:uncharacterized protein YndB with AHSA1/START domain